MRALSIRQPWAYLIAIGAKDVENRSWLTRFRGRIYIHASKRFDNYAPVWLGAKELTEVKALIPGKDVIPRGL